MNLDLTLLALGVLMLWFPRQWMRRGVALLQRRRRSAKGVERIVEPWKDREPGDPRVNARVEFLKFRNYIDLFRGMAGSLVIWGGLGIAPAVEVAEGAARGASWKVLGIRAGITVVGVLIQSLRLDHRRVSFFPPIFFLTGLSVGLCGYRGAAFAWVAVWAVNVALPNSLSFLSAYAALMVAFGFAFTRIGSLPVILAGVVTFLPALLSMMANRPLMIYTRKGSRAPKPA